MASSSLLASSNWIKMTKYVMEAAIIYANNEKNWNFSGNWKKFSEWNHITEPSKSRLTWKNPHAVMENCSWCTCIENSRTKSFWASFSSSIEIRCKLVSMIRACGNNYYWIFIFCVDKSIHFHTVWKQDEQ